ncbi:MAG: type IV secretion protein IcmD [Gammaproteobacteria bacterium]|nr:type IV secretion protein IcmD [Gammaproteobacteria bacterium]
MFKLKVRLLNWGVLSRLFVLIAGVVIADAATAQATVTLTSISSNVSGAVTKISAMLEDIAVITGVGFILASFFKFHQHKLQPQQVPLSQGITLLVIGAGLSVFPHLLNTGAAGVFGATVAKLGSGGIGGIIST